MGRIVSYRLELIFTKPSGIIEISPICSFSAFSEICGRAIHGGGL